MYYNGTSEKCRREHTLRILIMEYSTKGIQSSILLEEKSTVLEFMSVKY